MLRNCLVCLLGFTIAPKLTSGTSALQTLATPLQPFPGTATPLSAAREDVNLEQGGKRTALGASARTSLRRERPSAFVAGGPVPIVVSLLLAAAQTLEHTRWGLLESQLATPPPTSGRDRIRLEFKDDRLSADSGCNTGSAGYRVEADGSLVLTTPMAMTMMGCVEAAASYELVFFRFLSSRPKLSRDSDGEVLVLRAAGGGPVSQSLIRLHKEPMPSREARTKLIYVAANRAPCMGVAPRECLQVRERPDEAWQLFSNEIIGFKYEPGVEYRLRVLEDDVPNAPAHGASKRWFLDVVLEQKLVLPRK
ncbi:MAG: DUF4377 domain-containing protein [Myxococcaceae bacterium]